MPLTPKHGQISLFDTPEASGAIRLEALKWPAAERFPLNTLGQRVRHQVLGDREASCDPLIVACYTSID